MEMIASSTQSHTGISGGGTAAGDFADRVTTRYPALRPSRPMNRLLQVFLCIGRARGSRIRQAQGGNYILAVNGVSSRPATRWRLAEPLTGASSSHGRTSRGGRRLEVEPQPLSARAVEPRYGDGWTAVGRWSRSFRRADRLPAHQAMDEPSAHTFSSATSRDLDRRACDRRALQRRRRHRQSCSKHSSASARNMSPTAAGIRRDPPAVAGVFGRGGPQTRPQYAARARCRRLGPAAKVDSGTLGVAGRSRIRSGGPPSAENACTGRGISTDPGPREDSISCGWLRISSSSGRCRGRR